MLYHHDSPVPTRVRDKITNHLTRETPNMPLNSIVRPPIPTRPSPISPTPPTPAFTLLRTKDDGRLVLIDSKGRIFIATEVEV